MGSWIFLLVILFVSYISNNRIMIYATMFVMIIKTLPKNEFTFNILKSKSMYIGVLIITIGILTPIATGEVGLKELLETFKSFYGWVAMLAGITVSILSRYGINYQSDRPEITVSLMVGTIIGVVLLNGVAAGPVIAGGITYVLVTIITYFIK